MSSDDISISSRPLMKELNILNVYQISILHLSFIFKVKFPRAINQVFPLIDHIYLTRFCYSIFKICDFNLKLTHFAIGCRAPTICNKFLTESEKSYTSIAEFESKVKEKIMNFPDEFLFF